MKLLDIPFVNGYKTAIAGWGLVLAGLADFLAGLAILVALFSALLTGDMTIQDFAQKLPEAVGRLTTLLVGLGILGVGHKIEKASNGQ